MAGQCPRAARRVRTPGRARYAIRSRADQLPTEVFRLGSSEESGWLRPDRLTARAIVPFRNFKAECEREYIEAVLQRCGWSVTEAARALGLQRTYLHAKVVALGIARPGRPMVDATDAADA